MGTIKFGLKHSFKLLVRNDSQKDMTLNRLTVGCTSCTKAATSKRHLSPSEIAVIDVEFTPGVLGPQKKSVTLSYDDTSLRLEFIADVKD